MKRVTLYLLIFISVSFTCLGQSLADLDTNKYRIFLPRYWKPGNKVWRILTQKLPVVCDEIREKELCGDGCNPKYTIELEIYEPLATDYDFYCTNAGANSPIQNWVFLTYYNFHSSFLLLNEKREIITRFIIVDTTETWMVRHRQSFRLTPEVSYRPARNARGQTQQSLPVQQVRYRDTVNPMSFVEQNKHVLLPSDLELFAIIDKKIRAW